MIILCLTLSLSFLIRWKRFVFFMMLKWHFLSCMSWLKGLQYSIISKILIWLLPQQSYRSVALLQVLMSKWTCSRMIPQEANLRSNMAYLTAQLFSILLILERSLLVLSFKGLAWLLYVCYLLCSRLCTLDRIGFCKLIGRQISLVNCVSLVWLQRFIQLALIFVHSRFLPQLARRLIFCFIFFNLESFIHYLPKLFIWVWLCHVSFLSCFLFAFIQHSSRWKFIAKVNSVFRYFIHLCFIFGLTTSI